MRDEETPWHRVINAQGRISGRGELMRAEVQRERLEAEGVEFDARERVDLKRFRGEIERMIDNSYQLVVKGLIKADREALALLAAKQADQP